MKKYKVRYLSFNANKGADCLYFSGAPAEGMLEEKEDGSLHGEIELMLPKFMDGQYSHIFSTFVFLVEAHCGFITHYGPKKIISVPREEIDCDCNPSSKNYPYGNLYFRERQLEGNMATFNLYITVIT